MKHTLVALMEDKPGVLNRVVNMFSRRAFNIESLTVGHTDQRGISRMTVVADGTNTDVEQVVKQLYKLIDVIKVSDVTHDKTVLRDLALIKVSATRDTRTEIVQIAGILGAQIVDLAHDSVIVQMADEEEKIDDFVRLVRPFGIKEMVRTGRVAMARGALNVQRAPEAEELATATARPRYDVRTPSKKKVTADLTGDAG
ncbi:MAG TPA: acetolactate synthase small subunit [Chloroflexota bacterium]|jgi:acetolactate synthase-1/3 small subunit|nr:acetolactate synthase small subunit [Chloroflexota bacterium]